MLHTANLYATLAGSSAKVQLHANSDPKEHPGHGFAAALLNRLKKEGVDLSHLHPARIPVVDDEIMRSRNPGPEGYWLSDAEASVDFLIRVQADHMVGSWIADMRYNDRHCGGYVHLLMEEMPSIEAAVAILGANVGLETIRSQYDRPDAPWVRDPELCQAVVSEMESWAKTQATPKVEAPLFGHETLFRTPMTMPIQPTNNIQADFLDWISARIAHCLNKVRPAILVRVEEPASEMISEMISAISKKEEAS